MNLLEPSIYRFLLFLEFVCIPLCANAHVLGAYSCVCMHVEVRRQHWMPGLRYLPFLTFLKIQRLLLAWSFLLQTVLAGQKSEGSTCPLFQPWHQKKVTICLCPAFYLFIFLRGFLGSNWHPLLPGQSLQQSRYVLCSHFNAEDTYYFNLNINQLLKGPD